MSGPYTPETLKALRLNLDPDDEDEGLLRIRHGLETQTERNIRRAFEEWVHELFAEATPETIEARLAAIQTPQQLRDALERGIIDATDIGTTMAFEQLSNVGLSIDWRLVNAAARENARQYAGELITRIEETTRVSVRESVSRWIGNGEPLQALIDDLQRVPFSERRAKLIAATEVTGAYARANAQVYAESGVVQEMEWRTSMDEIVCPTCGGLVGTRAPVGSRFRLGGAEYFPPAHPGCRCWIVPVVGRVEEAPAGSGQGMEPSAPVWHPSMPSVEADRWAAGSQIQETMYHVTPTSAVGSLQSDGFDLTRAPRFGTAYGRGVYLTPSDTVAAGYESWGQSGANATPMSRLRLKVKPDNVLTYEVPAEDVAHRRGYDRVLNGIYQKALGITDDELLAIEPHQHVDLYISRIRAVLGDKVGSMDYVLYEAIGPVLDAKGYDALYLRMPDGVLNALGGDQLVVYDPRKVVIIND